MAGSGERAMKGPRPLASLIEGWKPAAGHGGHEPSTEIAASWPEVVGADVARRTRTGRVRDGTLTVFTAGSTWSHQLTFLAETIVATLRERFPECGVKRLRFVVATGGTKALLDGRSKARATGGRPIASVADAIARDARDDERGDDPAAIVARLKRRQAALDARRTLDGWMRCDRCGAWRAPSPAQPPCAVCEHDERRAADAAIERILTGAPWLKRDEVAVHLDGADAARCDAVRRRLLGRWEVQLREAQRRLRRGALEAADRVGAWSYLMLLSGLEQHAIARAVVVDVLGDEWADALIGAPATDVREARARALKKTRKTNARAFSGDGAGTRKD